MHWDSIDPGVSYYAIAVWDNTTLFHVGMEDTSTRFCSDRDVVIEDQEIRTGSRVRPNDILRLAKAASFVAGQYTSKATWYHYWEWAGSLPEYILHERIKKALTPDEWGLILAHKKTDRGHIIEAVGLGLYHMRRTGARVQNQEANQGR